MWSTFIRRFIPSFVDPFRRIVNEVKSNEIQSKATLPSFAPAAASRLTASQALMHPGGWMVSTIITTKNMEITS